MIHRPRADDPRLAPYRHVGDHRWLRERGLFIAEGRLVVERLISLRRYTLDSIAVSPAALAALQPALESLTCDVFVCDTQLLRSLTGLDFHRGCLALARRPDPHMTELLLAATRLLALEGVGNPDNVGGIFRVAAAFGIDGVLLDPISCDPFYRKAIRTSMGAALRVPWVRSDAWPDDLWRYREGGFKLVALTPASDAIALHDFAAGCLASDRLMLMLGGEGSGLSPGALAAADSRVRIPMDSTVDSLNVVVAAGIALDRLR